MPPIILYVSLQKIKLRQAASQRLTASHSVANEPKFRPQNTKGALKNSVRPEKLAAKFPIDLTRKVRKGAELF
jgi:hypothetical protein